MIVHEAEKLLTAEIKFSQKKKTLAISRLCGASEKQRAKTKQFVAFVTEMQCIIYAFLRFSGFMCAFYSPHHIGMYHISLRKKPRNNFFVHWNKQQKKYRME